MMLKWIVTTQETQNFNQLIEAGDREQALEFARSNHYDGRIDLKDDVQHTAIMASAGQIESYEDLIIRTGTVKIGVIHRPCRAIRWRL